MGCVLYKGDVIAPYYFNELFGRGPFENFHPNLHWGPTWTDMIAGYFKDDSKTLMVLAPQVGCKGVKFPMP